MSRGQRISYIILVALVALFSGTTYTYYKEYRSLLKKMPASQESIATLLKEVGRLIILPENESPTIATVSDLSKLKNQVFFEHAQIGDKVLIYTTARKAILYNPKEQKIIEVAPLNIGTQTTSTVDADVSIPPTIKTTKDKQAGQ